MTAPLPPWRVVEHDAFRSTVEFDLPDFTRAQITVSNWLVGSPAMEYMIRQAIARREETKDQLREGI